ncbi:hypothetical protein VTK56DRAFT_5577 [Thermocarpiscus australiensis]
MGRLDEYDEPVGRIEARERHLGKVVGLIQLWQAGTWTEKRFYVRQARATTRIERDNCREKHTARRHSTTSGQSRPVTNQSIV